MTHTLAIAAASYRIAKDELLQRYPELADDETALLDTLEGITSAQDQIAELLNSAIEDKYLVESIQKHQRDLMERKVDYQIRAERKRKIAMHYMDLCGLKKIVDPRFTASRRAVPPAVVITDENEIPDAFMRFKKEPDKVTIKEALKSGQQVPGTHLSNGGETLALKI